MREASRVDREITPGLMKTYTKLSVSFFRCLGDRLGLPNGTTAPLLPDLVRNATKA